MTQSAATSPPVLEVAGLRVEFAVDGRTVHAVNDVDMTLSRGEALGIVGESGSGKSVSVLSLMGLVKEPPGQVTSDTMRLRGEPFDVHDYEQLSQIRGRQIAMVFQDPMTSLNPVMTIESQLREGLQFHLGLTKREARARCVELLETVGIPDARNRMDDYPHQFSGGMRQRVMIAMALSCEPEVLIADEPTTALDVTVQAEIVDLLIDLRHRLGLSIIWITHDLSLLARLVDRIAVMYAGRIVEEGPAEKIYESPRHPYTIGLLRSVPTPVSDRDLPLITIPGSPPNATAVIVACPFMPRCTYAIEACATDPPLEPVDQADRHQVACWVRPDGQTVLAEWKAGFAPSEAGSS